MTTQIRFAKYQDRVNKAFQYSQHDLLRNIATLLNGGKEVPRSITVTFTINLDDVIDIEAKEIKDEDKK